MTRSFDDLGYAPPVGWFVGHFNDIVASNSYSCVGGPFGSDLTKKHYVPEGVPVIRGTNLNGTGRWVTEEDFVYVSEDRADELYRNLAYPGDIVFTQRGTLGQVARIHPRASFRRFLLSQSQMKGTLDSTKADADYVCFYFKSSFAQAHIKRSTIATGLPHINLGILRAFPIALPPLGEQRKIAAILASVDETIEKTEAVLAQLQVVKKAMMQELLTRGLPGRHTRFKRTTSGELPEMWDVVQLGDLAEAVTSGSRGWATYYADEGSLFVRITNLSRDTTALNLDSCKYVSLPEASSEGARTRLCPGDILISITADLGMVAHVPWDWAREAYVNQHIALVRLAPTHRAYSPFLSWYLTSSFGQAQFARLNDGGAKAGLNLNSIRRVMVPVPQAEEQEKIVSVLTSLDQRIQSEQAFAASSRECKQALMSVLLTGQVRVTPDGDTP
jgi:type I restriction enzyme S subunit